MTIEVHIRHPAPGTNQVLRFSRSPVRIGRNQLNDIPLEDPFVSEWHGIIRYDNNQIAYFDLGSTNGTSLDGKRLTKNVPAALSESSKLQLGMLEISVALRPDDPKPVAVTPKRDTGPLKTLGWGIVPPTRDIPAATNPAATNSGARPSEDLRPDARTPPGSAFPRPEPAHPQSGPTPPHPASPRVDRPPGAGAAPDLSVRQARFIEAFSEAFVGLRKGYEQFGAEVGVRSVSGTTPLHRARTARELLDYLMTPTVDVGTTARDLIGIFADFGIHNIALMEGITEGVRAVLLSLNPRASEIEGGGRLWKASKSKNQWKSYLERFDQLVTDDEELHAAIFGDAFARAYASVTMGDGRGNRPGEDS